LSRFWLAEELPADARGASWYQQARTRGLVRLDLGQPDQLDLPRRYGPFSTHAEHPSRNRKVVDFFGIDGTNGRPPRRASGHS
jgi:hypothetical protein